MYTRETTMTRLIYRLIERTVCLVSARRAPPMGPMPTMLTSPLGQAGIRPLPALAAKPLADAQERRGAMRISKRFKLSLMAALVGLAIHSGLVAASGPATFEGKVAANIRDSHEPITKGDDPETKERVAELIFRRIINDCLTEYPGNKPLQYRCETIIFYNLCPKAAGMRWSKEGCEMIANKLRLPREDGSSGNKDIPKYTCATKETGDQLCLVSPTRVSSGDLFPISIDIGDLNGGDVDNVTLTVQVSSASGAELTQPYRDPENPADFDLTWTGGPYDWVGTASLESISGTVSAQPVFGMGDVASADDSVFIKVDVDYTVDGFSESMDVLSSVEVPGETTVTHDTVTPE